MKPSHPIYLLLSSHPGIVDIYGYGEATSTSGAATSTSSESDTTRPFLVLERLDGGTLTALIAVNERAYRLPFNQRRVLEIARDLANVLVYLHEDFLPHAMVIHRDLKPNNIGFTARGQLKLMDFGISTCVRKRTMLEEAYAMTGE